MADTLKFGPEWLRALSDGNSSTSTPPPSPGFTKYKLADHRYGREEMLALFVPSPMVPSDLIQHTSIVVEKVQDPLALLPVSEEEQRIISQSVNSSAVLRLMGRVAPPIRGGRGGAVDRGRARGRGRGDPYIQRNLSFEDDGGAGFTRPQSSNRPEPWEEGSRRFEHQYAGRGYEEGPISPRREFSRSMSSENWRDRDQTGEENGGDGDWRRAGPREKWVSRGSSWRDQGPPRGSYDPDGGRSNGFQKDRGYDRPLRHHQRGGRNNESWEADDVPEWSMPNADDLDEPGTFDASGQFVSTKSSDDGGALEQSDGGTKSSDTKDAGDPPETAKQPEKKQEKVKDDSIKKVKITPPPGVEKRTLPATTAEKQATPAGKGANTKIPPSSKKSAEKESTAKGSNLSSVNSVQKVESVKKDTGGKASSKVGSASTTKGVNSVNKDKAIGAVKKENSAKQSSAKTSSEKVKAVQKVQPAMQSTDDETYKDLEKAAENLVATMTEEDEDKHLNHPPSSGLTSVQNTSDAENAMKWFYRDPQGDVQGPFTSAEMAEWFSAGYFTMNLLVKRGRDELFQQLGELIKHCGGVPFLSNPAAPPTTTPSTASPFPADIPPAQPPPSAAQQEQMKIFQQMMLQQHMVQQQYLMRQMQVQQTVERLQEQDSFKSLPIQQQHQFALQLIVKQQQQQMLLQQQRAQQGSPRTTPTESVGEATHPVFQRSVSQPTELTAKQIEEATAGWSDMNSIGAGAWSQPSSVWDLDPQPKSSSPSVIDLQKERVQRLKEQDEDEQRKRQDELLRNQKEEILRKTEEMQRMKEEIERQKQQEMQRIEELRRKQEEEFRHQEEEQRRLQEERQKKEEEDYKLHQEELRKQEQEILRQQELIRQQQLQKADLMRQQDLKRQQKEQLIREELQRHQQAQKQKEMELERQRQAELQRRQEMQRQQEIQRQQDVQRQQQQDALRRLQQQQEQLNNIQLPPTAQWANQPSINQGQASMSLAEIQQHEEMECQEKEELNRQLEAQQRLHMQALQQQQHKSWSNQMTSNNNESLLEIQEEQTRQLKKQEGRKQKQQQQQPQRPQNLGAVSASVWGSATAAHWSTDTSRGTESSKNASNNPLGFWDDAIIASKKAPTNTNKAVDNNFPTLAGQPGHRPVINNQSCRNPKVSKSKKEEETLQRLFQASKPGDDFTMWCESTLKNMATSVDIPTFVAFLQEVESPYEVHDYVRSYLGETPSTQEFARQFLEMRIQYKNKGRPRSQTEDSIWGPPPVNNPRDSRTPSAALNDEYQKAKGKGKKKKMQRLDGSILGFTVQANPNRINVGEIDIADAV